MKNKITLFLILIISAFINSCGIFINEPKLNEKPFECANLDYNELFYTFNLEWYQENPPLQNKTDDFGVSMSLLPHGGTTWYYNPVDVGFWGTNLFDRYMKTQDSLYLDYAFRHRDKLIDLMNDEGYLEYRLDYNHYDRTYYDPWYSGIAQGQALSLFSRLAYYAQDSLSETMAHKVFKTVNPYDPISDEVVYVDSGYAWIEEYPHDPPDHTFGGFMRATIGVYDYYHLLNDNRKTAHILSAYLTTVKDNMYRFRNPGGVYFYDLMYKESYPNYQLVVVEELEFLTKMSQDSGFAIFADTLKSDYWVW